MIINLLIMTFMFSANGSASRDAKEIVRIMEENMRGDASYQEMTMETVRPRYTREISMMSWSLDDDYALVYVTAPAREEGTAFLKRGDEMWNYQPRIDRTVKMPPSMMSQSWMGSDFTNDDLVSGTSTVDDYEHELLGEETVDGHECFKIELIPHPETPVAYEKVIYWIHGEYYLPVKVENYDDLGDLVSTMNFRDFKIMGGRRIPSVMEMIPHNKDDQKTIITIEEADYGIDISEDFFSIQNLTRSR